MAYAIELDNGTIIEVPNLATDGSNWKTYRDYILYVAAIEDFVQQLDGTDAKLVDVTQHELKAWDQQNTMAKLIISITIPDSLLMCIMHLETTREQFKYLANQFETKKNNITQQEANPRSPVSTHQEHSEDARKPRERKATMNECENATVEESRNVRRRERKHDTRDRGRVEKRDRRGKRATRKTSEQEAGVREPGEEAADKMTRSVSRAVMPSSQDDDGRDMAVPCPTVQPQRPEMTRQAANEAAADAANPNATSVGPPEPVGASHEPQDELQGTADKGTVNVNAAAAPPSVLLEGERDSEVASSSTGVHNDSAEPPVEDAADDVSLAAPASSPVKAGVATPMDNITDANVNATAATPSMLLEGERDAQRHTSGTRAGQQHGTDAHSEGDSVRTECHTSCTTNGDPQVPDGIVDDPGGCIEPSTTETPPSVPLQGECDAQRCMNGTRTGHQHGANAHGEGPSAWAERHPSCTTNSGPRVPDGIVDDPGERTECHGQGNGMTCENADRIRREVNRMIALDWRCYYESQYKAPINKDVET
ncbi:hypothetical protein BU15DRAFT_78342 [Melanogaster broomeanus]|nr:hypothetical protein BU15DRAFT_78342 [Melanogaster broomeanus]